LRLAALDFMWHAESGIRMLNLEQISFALKAFEEWLRIYRKYETGNRHHGTDTDTPTLADISHSSLLNRLLSGKQALSKPPPRRWSYPDYNLAEGKEVEIGELNITNEYIVIDQCSDWQIELNPANISAIQTLDSSAKQGIILKHVNGDFYLLSEREEKRFLRKLKC
jgi:hypothetical protein